MEQRSCEWVLSQLWALMDLITSFISCWTMAYTTRRADRRLSRLAFHLPKLPLPVVTLRPWRLTMCPGLACGWVKLRVTARGSPGYSRALVRRRGFPVHQ